MPRNDSGQYGSVIRGVRVSNAKEKEEKRKRGKRGKGERKGKRGKGEKRGRREERWTRGTHVSFVETEDRGDSLILLPPSGWWVSGKWQPCQSSSHSVDRPNRTNSTIRLNIAANPLRFYFAAKHAEKREPLEPFFSSETANRTCTRASHAKPHCPRSVAS